MKGEREWLCPFCLLAVYADDPNRIRRYHAPCYFMARNEKGASP